MNAERAFEFEPGMSAYVDGHAKPVIVTLVDSPDRGMWASFRDARIYVSMRDCGPGLEHAGTRGMLLQQYRDRSGHTTAFARFASAIGCWVVDAIESSEDRFVGEGLTEGAAIMNALTRLARARRPVNAYESYIAGEEPDGWPGGPTLTSADAVAVTPKPHPDARAFVAGAGPLESIRVERDPRSIEERLAAVEARLAELCGPSSELPEVGRRVRVGFLDNDVMTGTVARVDDSDESFLLTNGKRSDTWVRLAAVSSWQYIEARAR